MRRDLATLLRKEFPARLIPKTFPVERYAHDAGMQWEEPVAVATPGNVREVASLVRWCARNDLPITARGAGSSIAGNAFGAGLVIDFSRRMNHIGPYDPKTGSIRLEPGAVLLRVNRSLRRHGRRIGPSPSSEAFCTIGGMVGNNAAGSHSLLYGATADNVTALRFLQADGTEQEWMGPLRKPRGALQTSLAALSKRFRSPWPSASKNSSGYLLDRLRTEEGWQPQRIFCAAEGTLGLVTGITLRTHPVPRSVATVLLGYGSTEAALEDVQRILGHGPAAVELVDESAVKVLKTKHPALPADAYASACSLVVDFFAASLTELRRRLAAIKSDPDGGHETLSVAFAARDRASLWTARRDVEPLLRTLPGPRRPLPFVEDVVVPVRHQVAYVRALDRILTRRGLSAPLYGHAGQGNLHVRPFLDLREAAQRRTMQEVNLAVARLAKRYGGSLTGEHGDGYLRSSLVRRLFPDAYKAFVEVKRLFDPHDLFNPGKIVESSRAARPRLFLEGPTYTPAPWL